MAVLVSTSKVDALFFLSSQAALMCRLPTNPLQLSYLTVAQTVFSLAKRIRSFSDSIQSGVLERSQPFSDFLVGLDERFQSALIRPDSLFNELIEN
jgi:hypothetical protein